MRILMTLSQTEVTGAEIYAVTVADELIRRNHQVVIISDTLTTPTLAGYVPLQLDKRSFWRRLKYVIFLVRFMRKHQIQVVHAHSRASMWVSYFASRIAGVPMISTIHALEPCHRTRKLIPAFGDYALAVCENAMRNVVENIGFPAHRIEVLRNGFRPATVLVSEEPTEKIMTLIGRLSSTKGEAAYQLLENVLQHEQEYRVVVIGGNHIPERFEKFRSRIQFTGHVDNVADWMARSAIVIGSGRVAVEALLMGKKTLAFGAFSCPGFASEENLNECLESNFGDISFGGRSFDWAFVKTQLERAKIDPAPAARLIETVGAVYNLDGVVDRLEQVYRSTWVRFHQREIPILCYHRLIENDGEKGQFPTYLHTDRFEKHLQYLHTNGYRTMLFSDLKEGPFFDETHRSVILTFDDGYEDNYHLLFPLLKKYGAKAVIYLVSGRQSNEWDVPEGEKALPLMHEAQWQEMLASGLVEFGAHTMTHPDLSAITPEQANEEIRQSKAQLEQALGVPVRTFAYPYGRLSARVKELTRQAGFTYGIATDSGPLAVHEDPFEVRRIVVFPDTTPRRFARKVTGHYTFYRAKNK
ncbi:MAG: polysaccharide deacetylase family protein [Cytophagaceae bacterium]|nr:polysaccharide deacetylase family protein [Cytophagaceae bacterium]